jgi:cation diffusion facilitator family transporter
MCFGAGPQVSGSRKRIDIIMQEYCCISVKHICGTVLFHGCVFLIVEGAGLMKGKTNQQIAMRVSWVTIFANIMLSVLKLFAGIYAHSAAMVSDAVHSISDVLSTFVVIIGVRMSAKEADKEHPYGHERFECVAAIILSVMLFLIGVGIGYAGIRRIFIEDSSQLAIPGLLALIAAAVSIIIKEWMYWYTRAASKKINSGALMADAWHHRSDALSSIGSLVGIIGARIKFPVLDPIASLVICIMIIISAISIFIDSIGKMTDKSCDKSVEEEMKSIILEQEGVIGVEQIKTRRFGNRIYVEVEIMANGADTLSSTHEIAHNVHDKIEETFGNVKHCMVHVNPY